MDSIDIEFMEVSEKMIETQKKWKKSDPSDPSDLENSAIELEPTDYDPSDLKVIKWFSSFQISWITHITDPIV